MLLKHVISMRVEAAVQGRGALRRDLCACLRTGRALRVPRARTRQRGKQFITPELMISQRPPEVVNYVNRICLRQCAVRPQACELGDILRTKTW
jgi:hypothetical protein